MSLLYTNPDKWSCIYGGFIVMPFSHLFILSKGKKVYSVMRLQNKCLFIKEKKRVLMLEKYNLVNF